MREAAGFSDAERAGLGAGLLDAIELTMQQVMKYPKASPLVPSVFAAARRPTFRSRLRSRSATPASTCPRSRRAAAGRSTGETASDSDRVVRTCASRGRRVLHDVDRGALVLTNKRYAFMGEKRTVSASLSQIVSIEPYRDAVAIHRANKQHMEMYCSLDRYGFPFAWEGRTHEAILTGRVVACAFEGLIAESEATPPARRPTSAARTKPQGKGGLRFTPVSWGRCPRRRSTRERHPRRMIVILALHGGLRHARRHRQRDCAVAPTGSSPSLLAIPDTGAHGDGLV